ncbi:MAG: DUF6701 domain-containing protein [Pseudomonadota bacterium]|uniref:DUF6701 domain-containing protein n=1 Tax=Gallaecimonas pentaromativorans TaxID=584787 RepID=UPI00067ECB19|nr:DUF6701 domain-containing protein [Gallaecimonas pentaromativorans]MED5527018.1 DUF6701 domain-containing protein [Pseudomonadota bacterium]
MKRMLLLCLLLLTPLLARATAYNLSTVLNANTYKNIPCSTGTGGWSRSGSVYTCSGSITLASGDTISALANSTIVANAGFNLSNNTIGSSYYGISLQSTYGAITSSATTRIYGNVSSASGAINLTGTTVTGGITTNSTVTLTNSTVTGSVSAHNGITTNNAYVQGSLTASNGSISLTGGTISGAVTTGCCTLTTQNTNLQNGATAHSGLNMTGGTLSGDFVADNNPASFTNVTLTGGSISGASSVNITNSALGSANSTVTIDSISGPISLNSNTTVYGQLTAPNYSTVNVNSGSTVYGTCLPGSTPANACNGSAPVLSWHLSENSYSGRAGEVADSSGNGLNGTARNGASTELIAPALPTVDGQGTCRYGVFNRSQGQYLETADNNLLDMTSAMTLSLWVKPASSGNTMVLVTKAANYTLYLRADGRLVWEWEGADYWWWQWSPYSRSLTSNLALPTNSWSHVTIRYRYGRQSIFINGVENAFSTNSENLRGGNSSSLQVGGYYGNASYYFNGALDELRIFATALTDSQVALLMTERTACSQSLQCFTDDFNRASLGNDWAVSSSRGSFAPSIVNGRLRLTQDQPEEATALSLRKILPASDNLVIVQFDYYGWSPNSGSGADGMAAIFSDASVTPRAGAYGGSLGYAQKTGINGFAGGWLGVGLDEFGNYSAASEGREGGPGYRTNAVALRGSGSGTSGYRYLIGTSANLSPAIDARSSNVAAPGHRYRVTLDSSGGPSSAVVKVERDNGNGFVTLIDNYNALGQLTQSNLPQNFFLSFTGSTGANSNYHEIDNLQVCAAQLGDLGQQIHHFELDYSANALTCTGHDVTIKACLNADCSQLYTDEVSATLSPASGWPANPVVFRGGSTTVSLHQGTAASLTLDVPSSTPATEAFSQTLCSIDGGAPSSNCTLTFADSGFVFDVPDFIANQGASAVLKAVKKSDTSQRCVPAFASTTKTLALWSNYEDPIRADKQVFRAVSVNGVAIGTQQSEATSQQLTFNSQGEATLNVNYQDAGRMQLNARYTGTTEENGLVMSGSDSFVSRPVGFCIQSQSSAGECSASDASCHLYRYAGESFPLQLIAKAWDSATGEGGYYCANPINTPSYRQSGINLGAVLLAPAGGQSGTVGTSSYDHGLATSALAEVSQSVSEVGVFSFSAAPPSYFGTSINSSRSQPIGKFVPATVLLSGQVLTGSCDAANPYTYIGQPFTLSGTLTAQNVQGQRTYNYSGAFALGRLGYVSEFASADQSARLVDNGPAPLWNQGQAANFSNSDIRFARNAPEGPFTDVQVGAVFNDGESAANRIGGRQTRMASQNMALTGGTLWGTIASLRYGRAVLDDASGPENENLPISLHTQYWNGNYFVANSDDSCTATAFGDLGFPTGTHGLGTSAMGGNGTLAAGTSPYGVLALSAPGSAGQVSIEAAVADWLKFTWDGSSNGNPQATAYFGRFHGNDRQIYWQEIWGNNPPE